MSGLHLSSRGDYPTDDQPLRSRMAMSDIQSASVAYVWSYNGLFLFSIFSFLKKDLETNDTSFESPKIELLESSMKLGMA